MAYLKSRKERKEQAVNSLRDKDIEAEIIDNGKNHKSEYVEPTPISKRQIKKLEAKKKEAEEINLTEEQMRNKDYNPKFFFEQYRNMRTLGITPINNIWIEALAREMTHWVDSHKDAIRLSQFLVTKHMRSIEFERIRDQSDILMDAYQYTIERLAENREVAASNFDMNWSVLNNTQDYYCRISKSQSVERAKLRQIAANQDISTKFIIMNSVDDFKKQILDQKQGESNDNNGL